MFEKIVNLYRLLGKPDFYEAYCFDVVVDKTSDLISDLNEVGTFDSSFGVFSYKEKDSKVHVEGELPQNGDGHFFLSIEDFIDRTSSLKQGIFRQNFYIAGIDYFSGDEIIPAEILKIKKLTEFIKSLREFVAISIDREQAMHGGKVFFLKPSDGKSPQKAATLKINFNSKVADHSLGSFKILAALTEAFQKEKTQIEERILLMNTAIAHIIDECDDGDADFDYLIKNWGQPPSN